MLEPYEPPVSGHVFRRTRRSGDRWMVKWRDAEGQHQRVLGQVWTGRGRPEPGYLTKRQAEARLDEILASARRGRLPARARRAAGLHLAQAVEEWLDYLEHEKRLRPTTLRDYRLAVRRVLFPAFGADEPLGRITTERIEVWRGQLIRRGLAAATVNKHLL